MPSDVIFSIAPDSLSGNLWLSTLKGLCRFDPATSACANFDREDGLQSNEFTPGAYCQSRSGQMFFGGTNGFNSFYPNRILFNEAIPAIVISDFRLHDRPFNIAALIAAGKPLELTHRQNVLHVTFAALDYTNPANNRYAYMLEGLDADWTEDSQNTVTYHQLQPGRYTLRIKGSNNDGVWNEQGVTLPIRIAPPWFLTWWAYTVYTIMAAGLIYGVYFLRVRQMRRRHLELENEVTLRTLNLRETNTQLESAFKELKETQLQLVKANKAKSAFLANMSHELRTPLNAIMGFAQLMADEANLSAEQRDNINIIYRSGNHLLALINDVLDLSKIEAGRFELEVAEILLPDLLRTVCDIIRVQAIQKNLAFDYKETTPLPQKIRADGKRLRQILINLLGNAIKYTRQGQINFKAGYAQKALHFEIADTGIGIPPEHLTRIFEPFHQVNDKQLTVDGAGLGLAITWQIAQKMDGDLKVESTVGEGSTFYFVLPVADVEWTPLEKKPEAQAIAGYQDQAHPILVVDDVKANRLMLKAMLKKFNLHVVEAANGQEALDTLATTPAALVLLDLSMPVMDGFEFTRRARATESLKRLPIIALTANAFEQTRQEIVEAGADDFLTKPVQLNELQACLKKYLA